MNIERQDVVLELGGILLAADGAGRSPRASAPLICGRGRRCGGAALAPARLGILGDFVNGAEDKLITAGFFDECLDGVAGGALGLGLAVLPTVDGGEGDVEALGEFLLAEVELGAESADCGSYVFWHECNICYSIDACQ